MARLPSLSRCVLDRNTGEQHFQITRYAPRPALEPFVEHFWIVRWNLGERPPYRQSVLSHPAVNLTIIRAGTAIDAGITGLVRGNFSYTLRGEGRVFGVLFRPASFAAFVNIPQAELTDKRLALAEVFGPRGTAFQQKLLSLPDRDDELVECAEAFLSSLQPQQTVPLRCIQNIVDWIVAEREVTRVDQVVAYAGMPTRTLQRLFQQYVGATPKWVIQRSRLHEATARLTSEHASVCHLAYVLGYADQAHFIRDFKRAVERTPAAYARGARLK